MTITLANMTKIKWIVGEKQTGRYASFLARSWPHAEYLSGEWAVQIICEESYDIAKVKTGKHGELKVMVADRSASPWQWRTLSKRASTLAEAKSLAIEFLKNNPHFTGNNAKT